MDRTTRTARAACTPEPHARLVLGAVLLLAAPAAMAASVYKCIGPDHSVAYQQVACAESAQARVIELDESPPYRPSPQYALEPAAKPARNARRVQRTSPEGPVSFECRTADGQVFYRHGACPHSVGADPHAARNSAHGVGAAAVAVNARRIERDEACREIERAGAIGRAGHEHDEVISTYERNLGHDPCA
jgi:hypothetical protein